MAKKSWIIIDDHVPESPPDLDKAKAWLNDTFYGREGLIDIEVRQTPWHPDAKPEEPEPDEPTVPLEQIVKEYAEAVGELTGRKTADVVRTIKAMEPTWNAMAHKFEAPGQPRHHRGVKKRKVQSRQDKQASRTARRRERKARKAGR